MMVTTQAASTNDVPSLADVKERLRSEELRQKQSVVTDNIERKALMAASHGHHKKAGNPKKHLICHFCNKPCHFKRECRKWAAQKNENTGNNKQRQLANTAEAA